MAAGATMYTFDVTLSDVDRGVYEQFTVRAARHPSETDAFMLTRVLAFCLEYEEGIGFSEGISQAEEPAVLVRDATGAITAWIEVGAPDAARLHFGSKLAGRVVVYTHRDPAKVAAAWDGKKIHRGDAIRLVSFTPGFIDEARPALERRNTATVSVVESRLYLELNGTAVDAEVIAQPAQ